MPKKQYADADTDELFEALNIEVGEDEELSFDMIADRVADQPERHLLVGVYLANDSDQEQYLNWRGEHQENEGLDQIYDLLEGLGYEMSDEERALQDGTHELYFGEEEE